MKKDTKPKAEEVQPEPRFLGDPIHAQSLLNDPERRNEGIKYVAEHGWRRFGEMPMRFENLGAEYDWDALCELEKCGLYQMVTSILNDPHAEPYASFMPANQVRSSYRDLDDALRDAMGYSRFTHARD